ILQGDPQYSNTYFNFSTGNDFRGPWNQGPTGPTEELSETFQYVDDPIKYCLETNGLRDHQSQGTSRTEAETQSLNESLSDLRSTEVNVSSPPTNMEWNTPPLIKKS